MDEQLRPVASHAEPIIVKIEGVGELEFPGDTDPSVIQAKVRELTAQPPHANESHWQRVQRIGAENREKLHQQMPLMKQVEEGILGGGVMTAAPGMIAAGPRVIRGIAQRLYNGLLKPSKAVRQEFGDDVAMRALDNRRLITKGGAEAAESAVDASAKKADDMIANAPRPSQGVSARRVVREFRPVRDAVQARVDAGVVPASELQKIGERAKRIRGTAQQTGGRIDPVRSQTLKRTSQDAAEGAYAQMQGRSKKMLDTDDLLDAATARGFKGGLEDIIPGIAAQNKATQGLIGESRAVSDAVGRSSNHLPFGSVSDLAAITAGAVTNPAVGIVGKLSTMAGPGSAMAIGLNEASKLGLDEAIMRALLTQMSSHGQQ